MMRVESVMARQFSTVSPETPVVEIARLLLEERVNSAPVVAEGRLVGIVTTGDLTHRLADDRIEDRESIWRESFYPSPLRGRAAYGPDRAEGRTAGEVMTRSVVTVRPEEDMAVAARMLIEHQIHALPVLDGGRLVGVVSRFDLLHCLIQHPDCCNPMKQ